jgi:hypothetical protein
VSGVLLLALAGAAAGYYGGDEYTGSTRVYETGPAAPLNTIPTPEQLPRKIAEPNNVPALKAKDLTFREQTFTVHPADQDPVRLSVKAPRGWQLTRAPKMPGEVKFLDSPRERGLRVEAIAPDLTTSDQMTNLIKQLKVSQPYENDFKIISQTDGQVTGEDGEQRTVSTLIYTYIPGKTLRYVIVRWVATGGDDRAAVEMSITGLPQDAAALDEITAEASQTVQQKD